MILVNTDEDDTFQGLRELLTEAMRKAPAVTTERWQGVTANTDTHELRNVNFELSLRGIEDLEHWRQDIKPNLPWADDHFLERVGGEPLNPGEQWRKWPWASRADAFRTAERFNHTYMERLWPKFARRTDDGRLPNSVGSRKYPDKDSRPRFGIAWHYGDLVDLVGLLIKEPHTRQAWIPLFFPEDTGIGDGGRKPCTLGYQILVRNRQVHIWYPLRSCDFLRHWADDCYLGIRLLMWIVDECRKYSTFWESITPGSYAMHMTSLHVFATDMEKLR
jgi:hypothetical protein